MTTEELKRGRVHMVHERGFGFITDEDCPDGERFFHRSAFDGDFDDLRPGDLVEYEPGYTRTKGHRAFNVKKVQEGREKQNVA